MLKGSHVFLSTHDSHYAQYIDNKGSHDSLWTKPFCKCIVSLRSYPVSSYKQFPLGPLKGFMSWPGTLQGPSTSPPMHCMPLFSLIPKLGAQAPLSNMSALPVRVQAISYSFHSRQPPAFHPYLLHINRQPISGWSIGNSHRLLSCTCTTEENSSKDRWWSSKPIGQRNSTF